MSAKVTKKTRPKRSRRKEARPSEIIDAAIDVFLEHGFETAKLEEVARRAGVVKGTIYLYFETKEQLFRAVVLEVTAANRSIQTNAASLDKPAREIISSILTQAATKVGTSRAPAMAKLILREAQRFPDIARIWFDEVVSPMVRTLGNIIECAQARGEIRKGDAMLYTFSILGPIITANIYRELFGPLGGEIPDLEALARQQGETLLHGLILPKVKPVPALRKRAGKEDGARKVVRDTKSRKK